MSASNMNPIKVYLSNWQQLPDDKKPGALRRVVVALTYYRKWKDSLNGMQNALTDRWPWIAFEARRFVDRLLTPGAIVFEYGSGGSTIFYAERSKWIVSVEHDTTWFDSVQAVLKEESIRNCEHRLVPPDEMEPSANDWGNPTAYQSADQGFKDFSFFNYVIAIEDFDDGFFDVVSIDGRARPSCVLHARDKVKSGGYLLLYNSERNYYQEAKALLREWEVYEFYGPGPYVPYFWETTIWRKQTS